MPNNITAVLRTGTDDLRGGNDNLNLIVLLRDENRLRFDNVNDGSRWENNSLRIVRRELPDNLSFADILGLRLVTTFGGGISGDNWSLSALRVSAEIDGQSLALYGESGDPLARFTGENPIRDFVVPSPLPLVLTAAFETGSDDLRGGNDNVSLVVVLNDGREIRFDNVNQGKRWGDHSMHDVIRSLPGSLTDADIAGVRLETTLGGGPTGDNWNLESLSVVANKERTVQLLSSAGLPIRFTHEHPVHYFEAAH